MSNAVRAGLVVFLLGVLGVWLIKPIGDACPDLGRLPAGSQSASSPSFAPPLTRTCTYTTADGTEAHQRYVPIVDWLIVAVVAGVAGVGVGLLGPGTPRPERAPKPEREPRPERAPKPEREPRPERAPKPERGSRPERGSKPEREPRPERAPKSEREPRLRSTPPPPSSPPETAEDRAAQRERERLERARRRDRG